MNPASTAALFALLLPTAAFAQSANLPPDNHAPSFIAEGKVDGKPFSIRTGTPLAGPQGWSITVGGKPIGVLPPGQRSWMVTTRFVAGPLPPDVPALDTFKEGCGTQVADLTLLQALVHENFAPRAQFAAPLLLNATAQAEADGDRFSFQVRSLGTISYTPWVAPDRRFALVRSVVLGPTAASPLLCIMLRGTNWSDTFAPGASAPAPQVQDTRNNI